MRFAVLTVCTLVLCLGFSSADSTSQQPALPSLPELEGTPPPPLPGSAPVGSNPRNAAHLDSAMAIEGILAHGFGAAAGFERALGAMPVVEAEAGYLGGRMAADGEVWSLHLLSLLGGLRLSLLQTAVNGPSVGIAAGSALVWFLWGGQRIFAVWPQLRIDAAMKLSLGPSARGVFVEPRIGYKMAFPGAETSALPLPRYGGLTGGVRVGISF